MHEILKPCLGLFIISFIAALVLGTTSELTKAPIEQNRLIAKQASMLKVLPMVTDNNFTEEQEVNFEYVTAYSEGFNGSELVGYVVSVAISGYSGVIEILVGIDTDGAIVGIDLIQQSETPGLGANADKDSFTDLYKGKNSVLSVVKNSVPNDDEISAITSATITSRAVTDAVNSAIVFVQNELLNK